MYGGGNNAQSRVVQPRSDAATNTRLVVTNVHYEVTVDDLKVSWHPKWTSIRYSSYVKGIFSRVGTITRGPTIQVRIPLLFRLNDS